MLKVLPRTVQIMGWLAAIVALVLGLSHLGVLPWKEAVLSGVINGIVLFMLSMVVFSEVGISWLKFKQAPAKGAIVSGIVGACGLLLAGISFLHIQLSPQIQGVAGAVYLLLGIMAVVELYR